MSQDTFHQNYLIVGSAKRLESTKRMLCEIDGAEVALFNIDGKVYAISNVCPHQHSPLLIEGELNGSTITCPMHGWRYDVTTGRSPDGIGCVPRYDVEIHGDEIRIRKPKHDENEWAW